MYRLASTLLLIAFAVSPALSNAAPPEAAEKKVKEDSHRRVAQPATLSALRDGFHWIFDGKTLKGWHRNHEKIGHGTGGDWTVQSGAITGQQDPPGSGNGGILLTDESFKDFEVYFEIKTDWGCDSGFFVRSNEKGQCFQAMMDYLEGGNIAEIYREGLDGATNRTYELVGQYEEKNGEKKATRIEAKPAGGAPGKPLFELKEWSKIWKAGEWNEVHVKVVGNPVNITTWINGHLITKYTSDKKFEKELGERGHIAVQVHGGSGRWTKGGKVQYRNIQVKELK